MENTSPFQNMGVELADTIPEKCRSLAFRSHEYWQCYVKQRGLSCLHLVGTCSMEPKMDTMAVVDSKLR